jgi:4-aminobutyrate aminotransferase-like enzyme
MDCFVSLERQHPHVSKARGLGAMCAFDIVDPGSGTPDGARAARVLDHARQNGLLVMTASSNAIRTLMPLVISDTDLGRGLEILEQGVAAAA